MEIKATKKTQELVQWALNEAAKMYAGDIGNTIDEICHQLCLIPLNSMNDKTKEKINQIVTKGSTDFTLKDEAKKIAETLFTENFDESNSNLRLVAEMVDLVIRLAGGQWEHLGAIQRSIGKDVFFLSQEDRIQLDTIKDVYFGKDYYFGINSITLKDEIRVIYDFYKVWMFEMGVGGVYGYDVFPLSKEQLPTIEFKPKNVWKITGEEDLDLIYASLKEKEEDDNVYPDKYFKVTNYTSIHPQPGDTLIQKKNNFFKIIKAN